MQDYSKILQEAYDQFLLPLGGKKVPTPYRMNDIGAFQKPDPEFQGKSSPEILTKTTRRLAHEQQFDLNKASVEEIQNFMRKNRLGIDCSGFAYRVLNHLVQIVKGKPLTAFGFDHVGRTNVDKLASDEFTTIVDDVSKIRSGDILKVNSQLKPPHCLVVVSIDEKGITCIHSTKHNTPDGVNMGIFKELASWGNSQGIKYNPQAGDGVRRLRCLTLVKKAIGVTL